MTAGHVREQRLVEESIEGVEFGGRNRVWAVAQVTRVDPQERVGVVEVLARGFHRPKQLPHTYQSQARERRRTPTTPPTPAIPPPATRHPQGHYLGHDHGVVQRHGRLRRLGQPVCLAVPRLPCPDGVHLVEVLEAAVVVTTPPHTPHTHHATQSDVMAGRFDSNATTCSTPTPTPAYRMSFWMLFSRISVVDLPTR